MARERKGKHVSFRITESDYAVLEQRASEVCNITLGDYIRQAVMKSRVVDMKQLTANVSLLRLELNKIGVNVNQLARLANSAGYDDGIAVELGKLLDDAKRALADIVRGFK
jgi:DNA-binding winged helix-turn-helix (wHTH) protein